LARQVVFEALAIMLHAKPSNIITFMGPSAMSPTTAAISAASPRLQAAAASSAQGAAHDAADEA
jgi:hypothetical protein